MFNEFSIVSTALSSFNNASLLAPYFFAIGILSLPLFYMVYVRGQDVLNRIGWTGNVETKISFWCVFFLVGWLLLFGGNYAVIRDGVSLLFVGLASILFLSMIYITKQSVKLNYLKFLKNTKLKWTAFCVLLLLTAFSAKPGLYGILLQLSAVICGIIVGSRLRKNISDLFISTLIFGTMTVFVLMQPEFFRFGQLGNLTFIHLVALFFTGFFAITALVVKYTNACSKIYERAYVKLKCFFRIVALLALILFVLTESVPVFIGSLVAVGMLEMLKIYHSKGVSEIISKQAWALLLVCFGVLIVCPVISCLGIVYLAKLNQSLKAKDFYGLL